jgi:hypothetical protein
MLKNPSERCHSDLALRERNLALETKDLRDSSSSRGRGTPRNDRLDGFFSILLVAQLGVVAAIPRLWDRQMVASRPDRDRFRGRYITLTFPCNDSSPSHVSPPPTQMSLAS